MRRIFAIMAAAAMVLSMSGCATAWRNVTYTDDLYSVHNKIAIANRQKAEAELAKAQYEAQQAQYEANLAKIKAEAAKQGVTISEGNVNVYDAVLADSYESAYARRLYGFSSPTYRMPSSYYSLQYSDAFHYASAYDPAFYNVMVSGDMVWVEPKYITSMFGSWGAAVVPSYGWYYGWGAPYRYGYYGYNPYDYYWNMGWYYGWNNPYYWGWGYPCYHSHYYHHHHHNHYRPHRPPHHHHNPPHAGSGSVGNTGHHTNRPGMVVGRNPGASRPVDRGGSVGSPSLSRPSSGRTTQPVYRGGSKTPSSSRYNGSGSSSYRSSGSSSYRSSSSSSSSSSSYRSTPSFSSGGHSSYSGGSSGGSSGGGNSRGR